MSVTKLKNRTISVEILDSSQPLKKTYEIIVMIQLFFTNIR